MKNWIESSIETATKKASQSMCKYKVSALAFDKRGKLIATAVNKPRLSREGGGVHAEMAVLHKAGTKVKTILIARVGNGGDLLPIHSCKRCKKVLDKLGIKVYSVCQE